MFKARWAVRGAVAAALVTVAATVGGLLWLKFTAGGGFETGDVRIMGDRFFGILTYAVMEKPGGGLDVTTDVQRITPLIVLFLALTAVLTAGQAMYAAAKRRERLRQA
ncbi:hypothetical protein [Streptomyces sp. ODS28]|uniref:hypothetical protein n=1 Tax=Streptomyces sp. ODS28 TaxID=3136688 RepID=UPI0031F16299